MEHQLNSQNQKQNFLSKRYRFYLPDSKELIYPKYCEEIHYGEDSVSCFLLDKTRMLNPKELDFYTELASGFMTINGEAYESDVLSIDGSKYTVLYDDLNNRFYYFDKNQKKVFLNDIPKSSKVEILGDIHSNILCYDDDYVDDEQSSSKPTVPSSNEAEKLIEDNSGKVNDITQFESDDLEEDFLWDDEASDLIELTFSQKPTEECDIFIKSVLNRRESIGAWAFYFSSDSHFISSNKEDTSNKKALELLCLKHALEELSSPHIVKLHLDNAFLKKVLMSSTTSSLDDVQNIIDDIKPLSSKHTFVYILENQDNPMVESVIASDAARKVLK